MRAVVLSVALLLVAVGCAGQASGPIDNHPPTHPPGTNVGTSNPGVNQGTQTTTATRSTDS